MTTQLPKNVRAAISIAKRWHKIGYKGVIVSDAVRIKTGFRTDWRKIDGHWNLYVQLNDGSWFAIYVGE